MSAGVLLAASLMGAATGDAAPPSLTTSSEVNLRWAVQQVCLPWIRNGDKSGLRVRGVWPMAWGPGGKAAGVGGDAHLVGMQGRVNVGVSQGAFGRVCEINANLVSSGAARRTVLEALASAPERFTPAKSPHVSGAWPTEDDLCAAAPSAAGGLISTARETETGIPRLLASIYQGDARRPSCDKADAPAP